MTANNSSLLPTGAVIEFYRITGPVYAVVVPVLMAMCATAIGANLLVLVSWRQIRQQPLSLTLKLTFSLAAADAWSSLVILIGLLANSYLPYLLGRKLNNQDCAAYLLEAFRY